LNAPIKIAWYGTDILFSQLLQQYLLAFYGASCQLVLGRGGQVEILMVPVKNYSEALNIT
jgi:hypothetical protein